MDHPGTTVRGTKHTCPCWEVVLAHDGVELALELRLIHKLGPRGIHLDHLGRTPPGASSVRGQTDIGPIQGH